MAAFEYHEIFGQSVTYDPYEGLSFSLTFDAADFKKESLGGHLPDVLGASFPHAPTATQLFYGLIVMIKQAQGVKIDSDPTRRIFISDAGKSLAVGARDGQIKRSFVVNFFLDTHPPGIPSIDQIDPSNL